MHFETPIYNKEQVRKSGKKPKIASIMSSQEGCKDSNCMGNEICEESKNETIDSHSNLKLEQYNCKECGKKFSSKSLLEQHLVKHNTLNICDEETNLIIDVKSESIKMRECHICDELYTVQGFKCHIRSHLNFYNCRECKSQYSSKELLRQHKAIHYKQYACKICEKKYRNVYTLKHHICKIRNCKSHICETCGKGFSKPSRLKIHIRTHTKETPFFCDKCDRRFMHKENLKKHYQKHLGENVESKDKSKMGNLCDNKSEINGEDTYKPHYTQLKTYSNKKREEGFVRERAICNICGRSIRDKYGLERHMRIHTNKKPYTCDICNKTFSQKCNLNSHYCSHTKKKCLSKATLIKTTNCSNEVSANENTNSSFRTLDEIEEKPYLCEVCKNAFTNKSMLDSHYNEYVKKGNFMCCMCKQIYSCKENLFEHHKVHSLQTEKPYVCFLKVAV